MIDKKTASLFHPPLDSYVEDFSIHDYDEQQDKEWTAVASMLQVASKEGLLAEVVQFFGDHRASGHTVLESCAYGLGEWIK